MAIQKGDLLHHEPEKGGFEFCFQYALLPRRSGAKDNHQKSAKRKAKYFHIGAKFCDCAASE